MTLQPDGDLVRNGGQGGSVPVGKQECVRSAGSGTYQAEESTTHSLQYAEGTEGLDAALIDAGVFCLNSRVRSETVHTLQEHGVTGDDVAFLAHYIAEGEPNPGQQRKFLASLLRVPVEVKASLRVLSKRRKQWASSKDVTHGERNRMNYVPAPQEGEDPEQWQVERHAHIVWCRIRGDGATVQCVAAETGWTVAQVQNLYVMGHQLYGGGM